MLRRSLHVLRSGHSLYVSSRLKLHTSAFSVLYSRFEKDLPNPTLPAPVNKFYGHDTDILLDQLKKCKSIDKLLELVNMHLNVMNTRHIVACLDNIHECFKEDASAAENLMSNPTFKLFCTHLMKVVRLLEPQEVICVYKTFCALEVRNNTYLMQSVLKMIGAHLNNMNLAQLTFVNFLLHKQRHNVLVDGLKMAIPLVLQVQIEQQLDSDRLSETVNCLQLACRSGLKPATIQKVVNVIAQKASLLTGEDAVTVIFSLLNLDTPLDGYNELMDIAFEILTKNIDVMPPKKLCTILRSCRTQRYCHIKFFLTLADFIVSQKWPLDFTYSALSSFHAMDVTSPNLLDYFAEVLCSQSKLYQKHDLYSPLSCIEFLTATSYHAKNIDEAARVIYSDESKINDIIRKHQHLALKLHSCLAMLGHFPQNYLSEILHEENLFKAWSLSKKLGRSTEFERYVLALSWSLQLYDEEKNFYIPNTILKKVIQSYFQKNMNAGYPLAKFIQNGLGGSQFLQSGVYTEDGHVIDHIVAMRSGNYPVSLENLKSNKRHDRVMQNLFVEDIILPEDAKIIAVIVANENDYFREPEILKGWIDVKVRCLANKNYATVVVNYNLWKDLPDREKIPYLMREIKQVVPENCAHRTNFS